MAVNTVRVQINGTWVALTKNPTTGKYEGTIAAPSISSYNINASHYYPVTAEATDQAGNVTTITDAHATLGSSLKLTVKEVTKPTITFTAPTSGSYLATNTPTITFEIADETNGSGVKLSSLSIVVDGGTALTNTSSGVTITASSNFSYIVSYVPTTALLDGLHTIKLNIQDNDGNIATEISRSFTVDTVPPVLTITTPSIDTTYRNVANLTLVGKSNDATSSSVTVTVKLNSGTATAVTVDASGNFSKALTLAAGSNTIVVTATDLAGKTSTITRTVVLDTVAPVISAITITPNPVTVGNSYAISVTVTVTD